MQKTPNPLVIRRMLDAIRSTEASVDTLDLVAPEESAPANVQEAYETEAEAAVHRETQARLSLIEVLIRLGDGVRDVALILPDGQIVAYSSRGDGLALPVAADVHRL